MRTRLLEAAIRCLDKHGFTATTTLAVAKEAKVSRGAMLHHFPTRTDLLLCVVKTVFENDAKRVAQYVNDADRTSEEMLENMWQSLISPAGTAVREILHGSRDDRVFSKKLARLQRQLELDSLEIAARLEKIDRLSSETFRALAGIRLVHWCLRGLSTAKTLYEDPKEIEPVWALFKEMLLSFLERDVARLTRTRKKVPDPLTLGAREPA